MHPSGMQGRQELQLQQVITHVNTGNIGVLPIRGVASKMGNWNPPAFIPAGFVYIGPCCGADKREHGELNHRAHSDHRDFQDKEHKAYLRGRLTGLTISMTTRIKVRGMERFAASSSDSANCLDAVSLGRYINIDIPMNSVCNELCVNNKNSVSPVFSVVKRSDFSPLPPGGLSS